MQKLALLSGKLVRVLLPGLGAWILRMPTFHPSVCLSGLYFKVQLKFQHLKYSLTGISGYLKESDCEGLSTLYVSFIFELIFNKYVFHW